MLNVCFGEAAALFYQNGISSKALKGMQFQGAQVYFKPLTLTGKNKQKGLEEEVLTFNSCMLQLLIYLIIHKQKQHRHTHTHSLKAQTNYTETVKTLSDLTACLILA